MHNNVPEVIILQDAVENVPGSATRRKPPTDKAKTSSVWNFVRYCRVTNAHTTLTRRFVVTNATNTVYVRRFGFFLFNFLKSLRGRRLYVPDVTATTKSREQNPPITDGIKRTTINYIRHFLITPSTIYDVIITITKHTINKGVERFIFYLEKKIKP